MKEERPHVTLGPRRLAPFPCEHCRLSLVAGFTSALPGLPGLYSPARRYLIRRAGRPRQGASGMCAHVCTCVQYGAFAQAGKAGNLASLRRRLAGWVEM